MATTRTLTEAEIRNKVAAVAAGHKMAGLDVTEADREMLRARRRGEITTEQIIEDIIAGVDAGHRMASHEPTEETRENGRRILRGDISADDAVTQAIAKHQAAAHRS